MGFGAGMCVTGVQVGGMLGRNIGKILETLARGDDLPHILTLLCEIIEEEMAADDVRASVIGLDPKTGFLTVLAGPRISSGYIAAIAKLKPGPNAGACGTAIHRGEPVICADVATDPLWAEVRDLAAEHGIGACWSHPMISTGGKVLGTFALHFPGTRKLKPREGKNIRQMAMVAAMAIEKSRDRAEKDSRAQALATMVDNVNQGIAIFDPQRRLSSYNHLYQALYSFPDELMKPGVGYDQIIRHLAERGEYGDVDVETFVAKRVAELDTTPEWHNLRHCDDGTSIAIYRRRLSDGSIICTFTDITAEVRATFEIQRNAKLLATTLDNVKIGIRVIDGEGCLALWNQHYKNMFEMPDHIMRPGTRYEDLLKFTNSRHISDPELIARRVEARLDQWRKKERSSEIRETLDGRIVHQTREPMPNGGIVTTYADITHIRETEQALAAKSKLLQTSIDNINQGLLLFDRDMKLELVNRAYLRLFSFTENDVHPGMNYEDILRLVVARGEYGDADPESIISSRIEGARDGRIHHNLHHTTSGTIISVYRKPVPGGGFAITFTDITSEVRAGEEAKVKSALLQMTQDNMVQAICVIDNDLNVINFNHRWVTMFELPPQIARIGISIADVLRYRAVRGDLGKGDVDELVERRVSSMRAGRSHRAERVMPSGKVITIRRAPIPDGGFVVTYTDVTERWYAEREAERKSALLETMFQNVTQGIAVYDSDFRLISRNRKYQELLEFTGDFPAIGEKYDDIIGKLVTRGDFGGVDAGELLATFREAIENQTESNYEYQGANGRHLIIHRTRMPGGGFVITLTDVTDMRRMESEAAEKKRLLETALASMSQGIAIHDADLRLVTCNQKYIDWRGGLPAKLIRPGVLHEDTIRYRAKRGDYGPGDPERHVRERMDKMKQGGIHSATRLIDGRVIRAQRESMPEGGFVTTYTDITDMKQIEIELTRAKEVAEMGSRAKTEFLANMSHELRTPLNAIIGFSEMMQSGIYGKLGDQRYEEYARSINDSGLHLLSLIDDILDLSKIEVGKMVLNEAETDLTEVIESCLLLVREQAQSLDIDLRSTINSSIPPIRADGRKLKQVLLNLLQNAIKFTPAGGIIRANAALTPHGKVQITVADTGIGMKKDDIPRALERFGQVDSTLSRRFDGAGLGLPLARALTELHGGTLTIQSTEGKGTTVYVKLPRERLISRPVNEPTPRTPTTHRRAQA